MQFLEFHIQRWRILLRGNIDECKKSKQRCFVVLQLVEEEHVRGVVTMNEMYETKYFCNSAEVSPPAMLALHYLTNVKESEALLLRGASDAGVAGSRGGAAQTEHRRPHRRSHPGEPAPRGGLRPPAPRAGQQRVRALQGRTLPQRHAGCCVPHQGHPQRVVLCRCCLRLHGDAEEQAHVDSGLIVVWVFLAHSCTAGLQRKPVRSWPRFGHTSWCAPLRWRC